MPAKQLPDFDLVLFGGTGDLAMRKLLPALFRRYLAGQFPARARIVSVARTSIERDDYLAQVEESSKKYLPAALDATRWTAFSRSLDYVGLDATSAADYQKLAGKLANNPAAVRVYFLSTAPALFETICRNLAAAQLVTPGSRVVLEKPLGQDRASADQINQNVGAIFPERQIYRIDHYLGKEAVQNLLALRFGNSLFEPLWRRGRIRHVQITVAEELGVEGGGNFYDQTGALRDMVQNHLLQLLSIIAMEPPQSMDADAVRDEKLRVLRALKPVLGDEIRRSVVRGQYHAGAIKDTTVSAYHAEPGVRQGSTTETFVALKVEVENWRWAGVPFFLRTGKRLAGRIAEIVVNFRPVPHSALGAIALRPGSNRLTIRLQPNESIRLSVLAKQPGMGMTLKGVHLDLAFDQFFKQDRMEAYQRLLLDVIAGRLALFVGRAEQEAAWGWVAPIIEDWATQGSLAKPYASGTWGPAAASALLARHNTCWQEEEN